MLQAVMTAPGVIEYREVPVQKPEAAQVVIKTKCIGICGSDIHVYYGKHPYTSYPVVQGHEVCGEIAETGSGVTKFKKGDKVIIQPQVVCGTCYPCTHGAYNICNELKVMGFQTTGTASEFFTIDQEKVLLLPNELTFEQGAMVEPIAVGVHAIGRGCDVRGKKVLIFGAGTIGNLTAQAAKGMGAESVMLVDRNDFRLSVAKQCGIDFCINNQREDIASAISKHFGKDGADLILECIGANETISSAIENARKGTDIIIVGVFGRPANIDLGLVQDRELRLIGSAMYRECDFIEALRLVNEGKVSLSPLVTDRFGFREYLDAYKKIDLDPASSMKVIITF